MSDPRICRLCMFASFVVMLSVVVAGCSTASVGDFCKIAQPLRFSKEAVALLPEAEVDSQLAHNRYGQKHCGWTP